MNRRLVNRFRRSMVLGTAASLVASFPSIRDAAAARLDTVDVHLAEWNPVSVLPVVLAKNLGFFADEGLNIRFRPLFTGVDAPATHDRESAAVWVDQFERTLWLSSQGSRHQAFVLVAQTPQVVMGTSSLHQPANMEISALNGASIGIQSFGSLSHRVALWILLSHGIEASDVNFIELANLSRAMSVLNAGQVQALCYEDPIATQLEISGSLRVLEDLRTLRGTEAVFGGPVPFTCLSASTEFIRAHPDVIQRMTHAMVRSLRWLQSAAPVDLMRHVPPSFITADRMVFLQALSRSRESFSPNGWISDRAVLNLIQALDRLRLPVNGWDRSPTGLYTNRFVRLSLQVMRG